MLNPPTDSRLEKARENIQRSLKRKRTVRVIYVYQHPAQAWRFVIAREKEEGWRVSADVFVRQYFTARAVVNALKAEFGKLIQVDVVTKNADGSDRHRFRDIKKIDDHAPEKFDDDTIWRVIRPLPGGDR